jgi:hypothetical protein
MVPAGTPFPTMLDRIDLYARFFDGRATALFELRVYWIDAPDGPELVEAYGPVRIRFRPGEPARDWVVRLLGVTVPGLGRYAFQLKKLGKVRSRLFATDYITIVEEP